MSSSVPADLEYTKSHEWLRREGETGTVGITAHAQELLSDVVYVELPAVGTHFDAGQLVSTVDSSKATSEIYAPLSGTITDVNEAAAKNPALLNLDPYGQGWLFKLTLDAPAEAGSLLNAEAYTAELGGA